MFSHCNMSVQSHIFDGLIVFVYACASLPVIFLQYKHNRRVTGLGEKGYFL